MSNMFEATLLPGMKRSELQKLAKKHGIKANMKTDDLIKALAAVADPSTEEKQASPSKMGKGDGIISASSTEDQSESEVTEKKKPKSRRGKGRKQKNVEEKDVDTSAEKAEAESALDKETPVIAACPEIESEVQTSSATEDEKVSPVVKKSKAKARGRGRARGRRGKKTVEDPAEEQPDLHIPAKAKTAAAMPEAVHSPAVGSRTSRSRQVTPVTNQPSVPPPSLPTPPNSGSRYTRKAPRRSTYTPTPPAQPTPQATTKTTVAPAQAPSAGKRSFRGTSKAPSVATPTAEAPVVATKTREGTSVTKTKGSSGKNSASGSVGSKPKKTRRGTFDKSPVKEAPAVEAKSSASLKDEIMAEIDRKVQLQVAAKSKKGIPVPVQSTKKTPSKRNWSKTHHGAFNKMESIDDYLDRKRKRTDALSASKKPKIPVVDKPVLKSKGLKFASPKPATKPQAFNFASPIPNTKPTAATNPKSAKCVSFKVSKLKTPKKATLSGLLVSTAGNLEKRQATPGIRKSVSVLTPGSTLRKSVGGRRSVSDLTPGSTVHKSVRGRKSVSVLTPGSTVRKSVGGRKSVSVLTPGSTVRKSVGGATPGRESKSLAGTDRKSLGAVKTPSRKSVGAAAMPFGQSMSTTPAPKNAFDLKASLAKPLAYKPHAGKLKPFGGTQESNANVKPTSNIVNAKMLIKKPHLKGRDERRAVNRRLRSQKRNDSFMANRGLAAL